MIRLIPILVGGGSNILQSFILKLYLVKELPRRTKNPTQTQIALMQKYLFTICVYPYGLTLFRYDFHLSCVIRGDPFYVAFLFPTAAILLVNVVVLIFVMCGLTKGTNKLKASKTENKDVFGQARIAFACSVILGLTWLFAVLAVGKLTETFQWLFCIFNSLQGFFIFVFYTARNNDARKEWKVVLSMKSHTEVSTKVINNVELIKWKKNGSKNFFI